MKKAFTLVEMLLTITIISVIMAASMSIIVPNLSNNNKILYKSAFSSAEKIINDLISDISLYESGNFYNASANVFCEKFVSKVNTVGTVNCSTSMKRQAALILLQLTQ
ncbi:MAG: prepilin-type N-terminal cleavage/methylation domain-containing protein [Desulfomicrobium escambiense]|nr:prepilin-type N-terminal cleavage/methylation domain-containing protein [Desulfomicrobium escambiense]